jgi:hypothetical protein
MSTRAPAAASGERDGDDEHDAPDEPVGEEDVERSGDPVPGVCQE